MRLRVKCWFAAFTLLPLLAQADVDEPSAVDHSGFNEYVTTLRQDALARGFSADTVATAFTDVQFHQRVIHADRNQPEKKLTLDDYIPRAVPQWKVDQARSLYQAYRSDLERIGARFGVQPRFIVALWGVESNFGRLTGNFPVISALASLAYEGRREDFFKKQLWAALQILEEGHIDIAHFKGSWAGAMGQNQFMPTSFLAYAVDGDGDGKKDIWQNELDVFASIANYLKREGWDERYTWGRQISLKQPLAEGMFGLDNRLPLTDWQQQGVRRYDGSDLPKVAISASLIAPDDQHGRLFLVYDNFRTLMRWNRSYYFGVTVGHLADRIGWPPIR